jgi:hypothetical protein
MRIGYLAFSGDVVCSPGGFGSCHISSTVYFYSPVHTEARLFEVGINKI